MERHFVTLTAESRGTPRRRTYQNRSCVVTDVVALVGDIVVTGMMSDGPEFWPSDVLAAAPQAWNGRPITAYHPINGAGEPAVFEDDVFGTIFSARYENGALQMEAFIDVERAAVVGDEALTALATVAAGETIAVSIGAWCWLEKQSGIAPGGKRYQYVVKSIVPDHLALGLYRHGGIGACGIDTCGGNRVMTLRSNCDVPNCTCGGTARLMDKLRDVDPDLLLRAFGIDPNARPLSHDATKRYAALHGMVGYLADEELGGVDDPPNSWGMPEAQARALGYRASTQAQPAALAAEDRWLDPWNLGPKFIRSLYPGLK